MVFCYDDGMLRRLFEKLFGSPWYEKYFGWLVLGGVAVAMALSVTIGLMQSVWFDEGYSILLAEQSVADLLHLTSVDTHPPFYYLLLKAWAGVFGWSEAALRSISVLALGGSVAIGAYLVRRLFGTKAALLALALAVFTPFLLRYGFEIRMYALASLIGVAATYVLVRAVGEKDQRKQRNFYLCYAVLVAVGLYTLYYIALVWIIHLIWLLWLAKSHKQTLFKQPWWLVYMGSALLFLPWLPTFVKQLGNGALAPIAQQMTIENLAGVVSFILLYRSTAQLDGWLSLVLLGVIAIGIWAAVRAFKVVGKNEKPYLVLLALYAFLPILLIAFVSLFRPMYVERYLAHTLLGLVLFTGVTVWLSIQKQRSNYILPAFLIAVLVFGVAHLATIGNHNFQRLQKPAAKQILQKHACTGDTVYIGKEPYVFIDMIYYAKDCDFRFYAMDNPGDVGGYAPLHNSQLRVEDTKNLQARRLVLVDFNRFTPEIPIDARYHQVTSESFDNMNVLIYER